MWTPWRRPPGSCTLCDPRLNAAFHLITLRGPRCGEAAGPRWCDIDLDEGVAVLSQQLQLYDGYLTVYPAKTARSARVIALNRPIVTDRPVERASQPPDQPTRATLTLALIAGQ
jgi:hypothetical protein